MPYTLPRGTVYPNELLRQKAREAAQHRGDLGRQVANGDFTLEELLELLPSDRILGRTRVKVALLWLPGIGTAKVRRIINESRVVAEQRLASLTSTQRDRLLNHPWIAQHAAAVVHRRADGGGA